MVALIIGQVGENYFILYYVAKTVFSKNISRENSSFLTNLVYIHFKKILYYLLKKNENGNYFRYEKICCRNLDSSSMVTKICETYTCPSSGKPGHFFFFTKWFFFYTPGPLIALILGGKEKLYALLACKITFEAFLYENYKPLLYQ